MASVIRGSGASTLGGALDVQGVLTYEDVTSVDSIGIVTARSGINVGTGASISSPDTNELALGTNNVERLRISSGGSVGIGTDNPALRAHIYNTAAADVALIESTQNFATIRFKSATNTSGPTLGIDGAGGLQLDQKDTSKYIAFAIGSERLRITSDGNALFGGTAVSQTNRQLVVGSNAEANLAIETHNTSASETANIRFYRSRGTAASPTTLVDNDVISQLVFYGHDGTDYAHAAATIKVECDGTVASNQMPGAMSFYTNAGGPSATEKLRITSAGNVAIGGLTSPGVLLHLRDSNNATQGAAQLKVSKGVGGGAAPTSTSRANSYIHLGGSEWGSGSNGQYLMGFGYTNGETGTGIPAYIGFKETSSGGYTIGDLIFGTRNVNTDTAATERLRITSDGQFEMNGVRNIYQSFFITGNQSYDWDFTVPAEGAYGNSFYLVAGFNHYYTTAYGAHRVAWFSARGSGISAMIDQNQSHSQSGGWTVSKPDSTTFRVTKTAGSLNAPGYGFFHLTYNHF